MSFKKLLMSLSFGLFMAAQSGAGQAATLEIPAIWNNDHANQVCPAACSSINESWNGHWWTTVPNEQSACSCSPNAEPEPAPAPSPDCTERLFCTFGVENWECEDSKGRTSLGDNYCKAADKLRNIACNQGEAFTFKALKCTKHPLPFE